MPDEVSKLPREIRDFQDETIVVYKHPGTLAPDANAEIARAVTRESARLTEYNIVALVIGMDAVALRVRLRGNTAERNTERLKYRTIFGAIARDAVRRAG